MLPIIASALLFAAPAAPADHASASAEAPTQIETAVAPYAYYRDSPIYCDACGRRYFIRYYYDHCHRCISSRIFYC